MEEIIAENKKQNIVNVAWNFVKSHAMPSIAVTIAIVTCFFVAPDSEYLGYFNLNTLSCLFCTLAVVSALKNIKFFTYIAKKIVTAFGNMRNVTLALVGVTYFGSMIMANDMALITFLPLGYVALTSCNRTDKLPLVFVMQNIAANLGGMLTPFGNPQNMYLYSYFNIEFDNFLGIMLVPALVAVVLILAVCLCVDKKPISLCCEMEQKPSTWRVVVYLVLFALSVAIVFNVWQYMWALSLAVIVVALLILDRKAFAKVDYGLLITFTAFFVATGNVARIDAVKDFLANLVNSNTLLVGTLSCQVISNVPTAVLLSHFTTNYADLLVAVNIGGLGTPIASLASLITLNEFKKNNCGSTKKYLATFLIVNFSFLAILFAVQLLINAI